MSIISIITVTIPMLGESRNMLHIYLFTSQMKRVPSRLQNYKLLFLRFLFSVGVVGSGDGAKKFQSRGVLLIWIIVGQGPTVLAIVSGVGSLAVFFFFFFFFCRLSY